MGNRFEWNIGRQRRHFCRIRRVCGRLPIWWWQSAELRRVRPRPDGSRHSSRLVWRMHRTNNGWVRVHGNRKLCKRSAEGLRRCTEDSDRQLRVVLRHQSRPGRRNNLARLRLQSRTTGLGQDLQFPAGDYASLDDRTTQRSVRYRRHQILGRRLRRA